MNNKYKLQKISNRKMLISYNVIFQNKYFLPYLHTFINLNKINNT